MYACNLFTRLCSEQTLNVPAVNGRSAVSAAVFRLNCLSHTMPKYLNESV
jgi:hypothetical protein